MKRKPSTPEQAHQAAREKRERQAEIDRLQFQPDVRVVCDAAKRIVSAQRLDVFALLRSRQAITEAQYEAVRRLEADLAAAAGVDKPEQSLERVDRSSTGAPGQNVSQRQIDAGRRVAEVLRGTGPINAKLLRALLEPQFAGVLTRWREVVEQVTGETHHAAAAVVVRSACENLAEAYRGRDYGRAA